MRFVFLWSVVWVLGVQGRVGAQEPPRAFPGAEGYGAYTLGGRGGTVCEVTNLNDEGPGSLRGAVEAFGPRIVVFRVSGTIQLESHLSIENPRITIAGQTAPGDGICLRDYSLQVKTDEVIIRYIRSRLGDNAGQESDSISVGKGRNIVIDHCSASWSVDETLSVSTSSNRITNITVQWTMITESLNDSIHAKGPHGYGSLLRGNRGSLYSFHHNLYSHHRGRSPRPGNYDQWNHNIDPDGLLLDFRNNVIYDFGGSRAGYNADEESITKLNYIGNYLLRGANSSNNSVAYDEGSIYNKGFFADNSMDGVVPEDPYDLVDFPNEYTAQIIAGYKQSEAYPISPMLTDRAAVAFERVMEGVGANFPKRDSVDTRLIGQVFDRTGSFVDDEAEVGGWPALVSTTPVSDRDHDGMPDEWESDRQLDPDDPGDGAEDPNGDGYTNLEEYLNWLVRPTVSIAATHAFLAEAGGPGAMLVTRNGYTTYPLVVDFSVDGTASEGDDYNRIGSSIVIPIGATQAVMEIVPSDDDIKESTETVEVRLLELVDDYRLDDSAEAVVSIVDDDRASSIWRVQ